MADCVVIPDKALLQQIFNTHQPDAITFFLESRGKCVFKADFTNGRKDPHFACVVRLEAENDNIKSFISIAAVQQIAATIIPELVPQTLQVGKAKDEQGRMIHFSVIEFVAGDVLDRVWQRMSAKEQSSVVAELIGALKKLHSVRLSDKWVKDILNMTLREAGAEFLENFEHPSAFGGPHTGFANYGPALLNHIAKRRRPEKPFCTIQCIVDSRDIRIQSKYKELGYTILDTSDMDKWPGEAVLCHNDLNPRNLIVELRTTPDGKSEYKLAGIIDWEFAGFYPPSYELSLQDCYLGGANQQLSFYLLLKEQMKNLVPRSPSQIALLRAKELIFESRQMMLIDDHNVAALIRKKFIEKSNLIRDNDPYVGWTRDPHDGPFPDTPELLL